MDDVAYTLCIATSTRGGRHRTPGRPASAHRAACPGEEHP
ncbi:hypothetical protein [Streptomyces sp. RTd22]|nr:hypothetical protein [Streptomyces sp. RTd22]